MKNLVKLLLFMGVLPSLVLLTSCKDDNGDVVPDQSEYEMLTEYMVQNDLDLPDVLNGWVTPGSKLSVNTSDYSLPDYYIMDLRSQADFDAGHIKDANRVALADVLDEAPNANGKSILVVCYTGQTAARAVGALRLMGYDAKSLKWGMSGWHSNLAGKWNANATDFASPNWVDSGDPEPLQEFSPPTISTGELNAEAILEFRVRRLLQNSSWGISKTDVLSNPANYFVNNKWPLASWDAYGHITGAFRIDENLKIAGLNNLDPSKTIVTYCYTGQTSAITTAWLNAIGFDNAKSLMFGVNGIAHSALVVGDAGNAHKKSWQGEGSASNLNFGYYDAEGNFFGPQ